MDMTPAFPANLLDEIEDHIIVLEVPSLEIRYANRAFLTSHGLTMEAAMGRHCYEAIHRRQEPCDLGDEACPVPTAIRTGVSSRVIHVHADGNEGEEVFAVIAYPIRDPEGRISHVIETSRPITEYVRGENERKWRSDLFKTLLETSPDGIIGNDKKGNIFLFNAGAEQIFGYSQGEVIGKINVVDIYPPGLARQVKKALYSPEQGGPGRLVDYESRVLVRTEREVPIRLSATLIYDNGEEIGTIGFFHDISGRKALEQELRQISITDSLTGLYNRRHFSSVMQKELDRVERTKSTCSILMIDIDRFKAFNDMYGHAEGDRLLREVGELIRDTFRSMDFSFRFGGEEFVIFLPETGSEGAWACAERFRTRLSAKDFSAVPGGLPVTVTASIGVLEHGEGYDIDAMVRGADIAMYAAKSAGRNRTVRYELLSGGSRKEPPGRGGE
jgi:diguanylate cyclase (GGDEF)-like protein/PAS domain S-box-containing protein